jgi:hypothetical protein
MAPDTKIRFFTRFFSGYSAAIVKAILHPKDHPRNVAYFIFCFSQKLRTSLAKSTKLSMGVLSVESPKCLISIVII